MRRINIHLIYKPFLVYFRTKRMRQFKERFDLKSDTKVLDVGGTTFNWSLIPDPPEVILVNITMPTTQNIQGKFHWVVADARQLPFKTNEFDIVYSNSVIEHLMDFENQYKFAEECRRVGINYFVQTPNRNFPIEPHYIAPFIHWLPSQWRRRLARNFTIWGWVTRPSQEECDQRVEEINLLNETETRVLFPDAEIWQERVLGLVKSIIAVRM